MNENTRLLLGLLRDYILQVSSEGTIRNHMNGVSEAIDWEVVLKTAAYNNVLPFVYNQIRNLAGEFSIDQRYIVYLKNWIIRNSSKQIVSEEYLSNIIDALNQDNIQFMILKGVILAKVYPNPEYRYSADADIHIAPSDLETVQKILTDMGYEYKFSNTVRYDYSYVKDGVHIEIHTRMFEDFYDKHRKIIEEYELDASEHTMKYNVLGKEISSLQPNEFLIHNICHMTKHFVDSGINLRHLMDISIYVKSHIDQLDTEYIMTFFKKMNINEFVEYTLYICSEYLGMKNIFNINETRIDETAIDEFFSDFLEHTSESHTDISKTSAFLAYYKNDKNIVKGRLIPSGDMLSDKYKYAKKHKWLLPIAWVHRIFDHIGRLIKTSMHIKAVKGSKRRVDLLRKLGLLK
jgi:hypothetical protein